MLQCAIRAGTNKQLSVSPSSGTAPELVPSLTTHCSIIVFDGSRVYDVFYLHHSNDYNGTVKKTFHLLVMVITNSIKHILIVTCDKAPRLSGLAPLADPH